MSEHRDEPKKEDVPIGEGVSSGDTVPIEPRPQRDRPLRGLRLVFILLVMAVFVLVPLMRVFGAVAAGEPAPVGWAIAAVVVLVVSALVLYHLFRRGVSARSS